MNSITFQLKNMNLSAEERSISIEGQEEISSYISKEGDIQIKIIKESEDDSSLRVPEINVKGEVTK